MSMAERRPSVSRLKEMEVRKIITPGQRAQQRLGVDRGAQRVEHQAPLGLGRLDAEAQERQPRGQDHRHGDQAHGVDEDRAQHVAQHLLAHDGEAAGAAGARGLHVVAGAHAGRHALGHARDRRYEHDGQRDEPVERCRPPARPTARSASSTEGKAKNTSMVRISMRVDASRRRSPPSMPIAEPMKGRGAPASRP